MSGAENTQGEARKAIIKQAARWLARVHEGKLSEAEQADLQAWKAQSPQHAMIWEQASQLGRKLDIIPGELGMQVLDRPELLRREFIKPLLAIAVLLPSGLLGYRYLPWQNWTADYKTPTGVRQGYRLADGTSLLLNTRSAVDVDYGAAERTIYLYQGDIYLETGKDPQQRPLVVVTKHGRMRALGTRFAVSLDEQGSFLGVMDGAVEITPVDGIAAPVVVEKNQQAFFNAFTIEPISALDPIAVSWIDGVLYADNMPLEAFIRLLGRYRSGILKCDDSAKDVRISGAFMLDDPEKILDTLQRTRPLRIEWKTRYWGTFFKTQDDPA